MALPKPKVKVKEIKLTYDIMKVLKVNTSKTKTIKSSSNPFLVIF